MLKPPRQRSSPTQRVIQEMEAMMPTLASVGIGPQVLIASAYQIDVKAGEQIDQWYAMADLPAGWE